MNRKEKETYHYRLAACCKNCRHGEVKMVGSSVGYYCGLMGGKCAKTKVCDRYKKRLEDITWAEWIKEVLQWP